MILFTPVYFFKSEKKNYDYAKIITISPWRPHPGFLSKKIFLNIFVSLFIIEKRIQ